MKALYLDGSAPMDVGLDGPALRVRRPGKADGRFPLSRIARIVAIGRMRWRPGTLTACLNAYRPVVQLDSQARFVRLLFRRAATPHGLMRSMSGLLTVPRFLERYEDWFRSAELDAMSAAAFRFDLRPRLADLRPDRLWTLICQEQHRRWGLRPGALYRYLLGLTSAQIACAFVSVGLPRRQYQGWAAGEMRLFLDAVRLERWRQTVLIEDVLEYSRHPDRRDLTAGFEAESVARESRIAAWQKGALTAVMGSRNSQGEWAPLAGFGRTSWKVDGADGRGKGDRDGSELKVRLEVA